MTPEQLSKSNTEHAHQVAFFAFANMAANHGIYAAMDMECYRSQAYAMKYFGIHNRIEALVDMFAVPNGGERHAAVAAKLKMEGVKKGVSDIFLPDPVGTYHGLFIEMKKLDGRFTQEQMEFIRRMRKKGYAADGAVGWIAAAELLFNYYTDNYKIVHSFA